MVYETESKKQVVSLFVNLYRIIGFNGRFDEKENEDFKIGTGH